MQKYTLLKGILSLGLMFFCYPSNGAATTSPPWSPESDTGQTELVNVDYRELQQVLGSYENEKAILLNIWATWCGPCVEELPYIKKMQQQYPEQLQVILLSFDMKDDRSRVIPFLRERGIHWKTYFKSGSSQPYLKNLSKSWSGALPYTRILDADGALVEEWQGGASYKKFHKNVKKAIEESS